MLDLKQVLEEIKSRGPNMVMIDEFEATSPRRAREMYEIGPTIIFVRNDGWSLGASFKFEKAAYRMWKKEWVAFMRVGQTDLLLPISNYEGEQSVGVESSERSGNQDW